MSKENYGKELYLQEKYDEAFKYLREDDPFESLLKESILITPKDKSNKYLRSPQLTLIELAIWRGKFIQTDQQKRQESYSEFLKRSSNKFVRNLIDILDKVWKSDKIDTNLLNNLNEHEKVITWYYIGCVYLNRTNYERAKDYIEKHIRSCEKVSEVYHKALMLWLLGKIHFATGHLDKAHEAFKNALEIFEKFNDWFNVARTKLHIIDIYYARQDAEICLELSKQALDIFEKNKYKLGIARAKACMGLAYILTKEYDMALEFLKDSLQILKENHPTNFAYFATHISLIYIYKEEYDKALEVLKEAEEILKKDVERIHYKEWVCTHKAIVLLEKGDAESAKKLLLDALKIAKDVGDYDDIVRVLLYLVRATSEKEEEGYVDEVLKYYKEWRTDLSSFITAKDILSSHDFRVLVDSLLDRDVNRAYDAHLEVKNRSAVDIFGIEVISEDSIGIEGFRRLKEIEEKIELAESPLDMRLIREARREISEIIENNPRQIVKNTYLDVKGDEEVIDFHFGDKTGYFHRRQFKEIQFKDLREFVEELLRDEAVKLALLKLYETSGIEGNRIRIDGDRVYIIYENGKYYWAKLKKKDDLLRLLNDILLACLTHQSHLAYKGITKKKDDEKWLSTIGNRIKQSRYYQKIVERILSYFGDVFGDLFSYDEIIIAPAYPLVNFPYHLIMDSDGKMLIETAKVKYIPHADVANRLRSKKRVKMVEKASIIYTDIPDAFTKEEAEEIKKIVPDSQLINATNLNKNVILNAIRKDANILHFACHAKAMPKAQYSYLSLSKDLNSRDHNLRIYLSDLLSLGLNNLNLVCLSACETGRYEEAIDTLGFPLAFFAKGAKNVIATQWITYGKSARDFFTEFYKLIVEGYDIYEAYHDTMLNMRKEYKIKFYWAPFIYCGI